MNTNLELTFAHIYPKLMNLYGDIGNVMTLKNRCEWRGIKFIAEEINIGDEIKPHDIYFIGGGQDRQQIDVAEELKKNKEFLTQERDNNAVFLAICGGYQLLGSYYKTEQGMIEGLSLVDMYTEQEEGRLISNIVLQSDLFEMPVVGFENHGGRTCINDNKPLGKVLYGKGNDGRTGYEGVVYKNVIGTYLHGPLLPKNPQLADWLILKALQRKYGEQTALTELDDSQEKEANDYIFHRFTQNR